MTLWGRQTGTEEFLRSWQVFWHEEFACCRSLGVSPAMASGEFTMSRCVKRKELEPMFRHKHGVSLGRPCRALL